MSTLYFTLTYVKLSNLVERLNIIYREWMRVLLQALVFMQKNKMVGVYKMKIEK